MSDMLNSALPGAGFAGFVTVNEAGLRGMITLRGDLSSPVLAGVLKDAMGLDMPAQRRVTQAGTAFAAWMSPDELLLMLPYDQAGAMAQKLAGALAGEFATVANVSDARAVFTLQGAAVFDALAKICPVDFSDFAEGDIRRTRAAQVAAALWVSGADQVTLVCFRSVAQYMFDLLCAAAAPGSEPALYA
ncbi:sarcosine oxidase subunit gamma [Roseinatronobacter alkalisoli]|uniref:Sarcosine oxidase subunit gamma family protein n=1 Tax=Roseinatronobacter alkalisoli TaxID=3028235 RepID=A0ABT5T6D5_9RHOB|nr:sarcosine oxidase subunit gamma family protein [Roseinatronobacter sp. HJB301]MDD7970677.1 sarcosine oxidase subunit gamma family protein [Roseinatronobacter sp. HJB301]